MTRAWLVSVACVFVISCGSKTLPHAGEEPAFPLRGKHTAVSCEACHGTDGFEQLPNTCVACHEIDRPAPDHFTGEACDGCHVEEGWEVADKYPTIPIDTGFDHAALPETQLCWGECHEADRPEPTHYADPTLPQALWWDCSGCHQTEAWTPAIEHPSRIPHGSATENDPASPGTCTPVENESSWVTGCVGCHPNGTDTFACLGCHDGVHNGQYAEALCLGCHINAEPTECVGL